MSLRSSGDGMVAALNGGYHLAFLAGALFAFAAAVTGAALLREGPTHAHGHEPEPEPEPRALACVEAD